MTKFSECTSALDELLIVLVYLTRHSIVLVHTTVAVGDLSLKEDTFDVSIFLTFRFLS